MSATQAIAVQGYPATVPLAKSSQHRRRDLTPRMPGINSQTRLLTAPRRQPIQYERSRGHSEMGSRDHGMVEFGVQIPMAPLKLQHVGAFPSRIPSKTRNQKSEFSAVILRPVTSGRGSLKTEQRVRGER